MVSRLRQTLSTRGGRAAVTLLFFAAGITLFAFCASYVDDRGAWLPEFALTLMFGAVMYPAFRRLEPGRVTQERYFAFVLVIAAIGASVIAVDVSQWWQAGMFVTGLLVFVAGTVAHHRRPRRGSQSSP